MLIIAANLSIQYTLDIASLLFLDCNACNMTLDIIEIIVCLNILVNRELVNQRLVGLGSTDFPSPLLVFRYLTPTHCTR